MQDSNVYKLFKEKHLAEIGIPVNNYKEIILIIIKN